MLSLRCGSGLLPLQCYYLNDPRPRSPSLQPCLLACHTHLALSPRLPPPPHSPADLASPAGHQPHPITTLVHTQLTSSPFTPSLVPSLFVPSKRTPHSWHKCSFIHPLEKARRRDLRRHFYTTRLSPEALEHGADGCPRAGTCSMAHNVSTGLISLQSSWCTQQAFSACTKQQHAGFPTFDRIQQQQQHASLDNTGWKGGRAPWRTLVVVCAPVTVCKGIRCCYSKVALPQQCLGASALPQCQLRLIWIRSLMTLVHVHAACPDDTHSCCARHQLYHPSCMLLLVCADA